MIRKSCKSWSSTKTFKARREKNVENKKRDIFLTTNEFVECTENAKHVSTWTIRRYLRRNKLFSPAGTKKLLISNQNKRKRLVLYKAYKTWDFNSWENIIFADESLFQQYSNK